jgi:hypothetical protein
LEGLEEVNAERALKLAAKLAHVEHPFIFKLEFDLGSPAMAETPDIVRILIDWARVET